MKSTHKFKCLYCSEINLFDFRNRERQHYCPKVECRKASKAASQRRWLSKPENENYFRGPENGERVRQWRAAHPGYSSRRPKKKRAVQEALQDICPSQHPGNEEFTPNGSCTATDALQDICSMQPALLVGFIAAMTGETLQEDIVAKARSFSNRGQDILRMWPRSSPSHNETKTSALPRAASARAAPI